MPPDPHPPAPARWLAAYAWPALALSYAAVVTVGLAQHFAASPDLTTPAASPPTPLPSTNLAHPATGARLRASSYYAHAHHHPIFAIDGQPHPSHLEKWTSHPDDRAPWLEVVLPQPRHLSTLRLTLAGAFEDPALTARDLRILCFRGPDTVLTLPVRDNTQPHLTLPLPCPNTDRVRIAFTLTPPPSPLDVARVYEVELLAAEEDTP